MGAKQIWLGLYIVPCSFVNTYLIDGGADGLVLIDAGLPGKTDLIFDGIRNIGRRPSEVKHIVLTHAHPDHIGGLAEIVRVTGAQTWMHHIDAPIAEAGSGFRPMTPSGLVPKILMKMIKVPHTLAPAHIDHKVLDGDVIPLAGGLEAIPMPGHCAGQIALLWQGHRVLFTGDACTHHFGLLGEPPFYEDAAEAHRSLKKLGTLNYDLACFGHGPPLRGHASEKIARKWAEAEPALAEPVAHH